MASLSSSSSSGSEEDALLRNTRSLFPPCTNLMFQRQESEFCGVTRWTLRGGDTGAAKGCAERRGAIVATLSYAGATPDPGKVQEMKNYFSPLWRLTESLKVARKCK